LSLISIIDKTEIILGGTSEDGSGSIYKFSLNPEGDWTPTGREKTSLGEYTAALGASESLVLKAKEDETACFGTTMRPK
jgi:hypothetical protein